ncbi:hypothetical protein GCM10009007_17220 [Formosimonas limnophila]|uniref:Uncharacterized protein n=1 Tax=Formosimonas limnophila TaxID=1384487 RepID=A0A8J3CN95_9BURK|nr:hypothetical protein [Formosimonas limnophila]GHA76787.1 hypothetical protein GCM10009007_17220 [Formosimonas limnophila]
MATNNAKAKPSGQKPTNTILGSVEAVKHSEPNVTLYGRIAGAKRGSGIFKDVKIEPGYINPNGPDLHFTIVIDDAYTGIIAIDGQPTDDRSLGNKNLKLIRTNFYRNTVPDEIKVKIPVEPPKGMSKQKFAQEIIKKAHSFSSYTLDYSLPKNVIGSVMRNGEYNSSSYISGLLKAVMGYVPQISTPGYNTPGWEMPIPSSYFKGEAIR